MICTQEFASPLGALLLACDDEGLTGLWFRGQRHFARGLPPEHSDRAHPILRETARWLEIYFSGREPEFTPPLHPSGTEFQMAVWALLLEIPYGKTVAYGDLARELAGRRGLMHMSAQAVGGAVGRNPVSIIVPCHRVLGAGGALTGYAAGLSRKQALLTLESALPPSSQKGRQKLGGGSGA